MTAVKESSSLRNGAVRMAAPSFSEPLRLNLGAGDTRLSGYVNIDRKTGGSIYPEITASSAEWPDSWESGIGPDTVAEIRASHVLEHFPHSMGLDVLAKWVSYLKPGGVLKVAVPDFEWIARHYLDGHDVPTQSYVMGGQVDATDYHRTIFDRELLTGAMRLAGLEDIRPWASDAADCSDLPVSLNLMGTKPGPLPKLKIAGAMSVPRLGFQDNFFCWVNALLPLGIKPTKYDGAYWGQCLERVMTDLAADADYVLAVDYDSVFSRAHVERLIRLAAAHPEVDALAPVEVRRGGKTPLMTKNGPGGKMLPEISLAEFRPDLLAVDTAHFGLTLIRADKLRSLPHPWFKGEPAADGTWGQGRIDDDIYFWRRWQAAGNSLYLANRVVIGHGQFMVTWPGSDFAPVYQHPSEFWESGMPAGVWE